MKTVNITIKKPLYGTFCYIRDIYLKQAIRENKKLRITIPQGTALHDPKEWVRTGNLMWKIFKIPDKPMELWGNYVKLEDNEQTHQETRQNIQPVHTQKALF